MVEPLFWFCVSFCSVVSWYVGTGAVIVYNWWYLRRRIFFPESFLGDGSPAQGRVKDE